MCAINRSIGCVIFFNTINLILCQFKTFFNMSLETKSSVVSLSNCFHRTLSTPTVILFAASACVGEKGYLLMMLQKKLIHKRLLRCLNCAFMYIWQCTESGWDGDNFLLSIPGFGCDWKSVGNTAVLVIAEQCVHSVRAFSFSCSAPPVGRKLGESTTCPPGTDWPAGIFHDI